MSYDFNTTGRNPRRRTASERRRHARQSFSADAEVVEVISGTRLHMTARVADLSMGGCYLDTINPFAPGALAHLRIHSRNSELLCVATVKSCQPGMGMGLAFEALSQTNTNLLRSWLDNSSSPVHEDFEAEELWKASQPVVILDTNGAGSVPKNHDALSLRLARLLHAKGSVLDDSEMARLFGNAVL